MNPKIERSNEIWNTQEYLTIQNEIERLETFKHLEHSRILDNANARNLQNLETELLERSEFWNAQE